MTLAIGLRLQSYVYYTVSKYTFSKIVSLLIDLSYIAMTVCDATYVVSTRLCRDLICNAYAD